MKRCKRTLALLLCAVLCLTALSASAFAVETWPDNWASYTECFITGSKDSAESTGRFPTGSNDRTIWTLSDGVLVIDGIGCAMDTTDHLFIGNSYVETVIVKEGVTKIGPSLFKNMPNLKNIIVMSNQTIVDAIVCDCPNMNNFILGANLKNNDVRSNLDNIKIAMNGNTGMAGGGVFIAPSVPITNKIIISSEYSDLTTAINDTKALIAQMNLPASALAQLPAELGGTLGDPIVSDWAQDFVANAKKNYFLSSSLGNDYTRSITRAQFADLAVQTYEQLTGARVEYTSKSFADCYVYEHQGIAKAYELGILTGYNSGEYRWNIYIGPNDPITREQAATMLARLSEKLGKPMTTASNLPFTDAIASWAYENVARVYAAGIMTGTSDTTFSAKSNYTIEQSIVTMVRIADYVG